MRTKLLLGLCMAATILFTTSCKKDSDENGDYYVKVKKGGTWISYPQTIGELGPDLGNAALTDLGVSAQSADNKERFDLTIQVNGTTFATGTYNSDNITYQTVMSVFIMDGSSAANYDISDAPGLAPSKYTINITSITDQTLTGTFTGNYLYDDFGTGASAIMEITEGEFHVKRLR